MQRPIRQISLLSKTQVGRTAERRPKQGASEVLTWCPRSADSEQSKQLLLYVPVSLAPLITCQVVKSSEQVNLLSRSMQESKREIVKRINTTQEIHGENWQSDACNMLGFSTHGPELRKEWQWWQYEEYQLCVDSPSVYSEE